LLCNAIGKNEAICQLLALSFMRLVCFRFTSYSS